MKRMLLGSILLSALFAAPVVAADMPVKAAPYRVAPAQNWTGCYVGANVGGGWSHQNWQDNPGPVDEGSGTGSGIVGGGQVGCDYQTGLFVFGIQGMFDGASLKESHPYFLDPAYTDHTKVSWFATLTGRIGYTVQPATLAYIKGGAAWVRNTFTETCSPAVDFCPGVARVTRTGWTIGGGLEHMFQPNWSAFIEYNYMDFRRRTSTLVYTDASTFDFAIKQNVQAVLVGVNYRFGGGAVTARY